MRLNGKRMIAPYFGKNPRNWKAWCRLKKRYASILLRDPDTGETFLETDPVILTAERDRGCKSLAELGNIPEPIKTVFPLPVRGDEGPRDDGCVTPGRRRDLDKVFQDIVGPSLGRRVKGTGSQPLAGPQNATRG